MAAARSARRLIDRIQDRFGKTIFKHEDRVCEGCDAQSWQGQDEPTIVDNRDQVLDPMTAYQMTSMLEGVVQRGTGDGRQGGRQADRRQDRHHQRLPRRLVRRLLARPRRRRLHRLRQAALARQGHDRRRPRRADLHRVHADGAGRQAADPVPRAAGHELHPDRPQDRACAPIRATPAPSSKPSSRAPGRPTPIRSSAIAAIPMASPLRSTPKPTGPSSPEPAASTNPTTTGSAAGPVEGPAVALTTCCSPLSPG